MDSKFFKLLDPVFNYIDSGKFFRQPFQWLYYVIGVLVAVAPFFVLYQVIDRDFFRYASASAIFTFIIVWLLLLAVCGCGMLLWFNRARKLKEVMPAGNKFVAIPALANFIQTSGEFYGMFVGVVGFIGSILLVLFQSPEVSYYMGNGIVGASLMSAVTSLIGGYIIVVVARFVAEMINAIANIANKCDKIAKNTEQK